MARDRTFFRGGKLVHGGDSVGQIAPKDAQDAAAWHYVSSSNVKAVCWREDRGLMVWFDPKDAKGKSTGKETMYCYGGAPRTVLGRMLEATSKGEFLHQVVIRQYPHTEGPIAPEA